MNRKFATLLKLALVPIVFLASTHVTAKADEGPHFLLRLGASNFQSKSLRSEASRNGLALGLGLILPKPLILRGISQGSVEIDYSRHQGKGADVEVAAIQYVERVSIMGRRSGFSPYIGAGVGVHRDRYSNSFNDDVIVRTRSLGNQSNESANKAVLGGKAILGANISDKFFVEGSYVLSGKTAGSRFDSTNITLGIKS